LDAASPITLNDNPETELIPYGASHSMGFVGNSVAELKPTMANTIIGTKTPSNHLNFFIIVIPP
jgi:hypothetical protein